MPCLPPFFAFRWQSKPGSLVVSSDAALLFPSRIDVEEHGVAKLLWPGKALAFVFSHCLVCFLDFDRGSVQLSSSSAFKMPFHTESNRLSPLPNTYVSFSSLSTSDSSLDGVVLFFSQADGTKRLEVLKGDSLEVPLACFHFFLGTLAPERVKATR